MTYQIIYSSESKMPMQSDDLEELLEAARNRNGIQGISGALIYADGTFLQILEGDREKLLALMASIRRDVRHQGVTILREGEVATAKFTGWKMAYVSATPQQVARWSGSGIPTGTDVDEDLHRTARFAQDILGLLAHEEPGGAARDQDIEAEPT